MKKYNFNSLLFIFVSAFLVVGIWGQCFTRLKWAAIDMLAAVKHGNIYSVFSFRESVDDITVKELSYHDLMMDIDSLKKNLLGTRVVEKDDTTVVKADSGSLIEPSAKLTDSAIEKVVSRLSELKAVTEENGAGFLYCAAPSKQLYETAPDNIENHSKSNFERFVAKLNELQIPMLDFSVVFRSEEIADDGIFYYTDHHWKVKSGFIAVKSICEKLSSLYGFPFNSDYTDLNNYSITKYKDWFLGSKGKKIGTYFTNHGADDFELIKPDFETDLVEEQPIKNQIRKGAFEETYLYLENMEKDYYHKNTYATYSGGDFRLQIMKNNLNPNGSKILIIRDSFACVVAPFLALQTSELHICDIRNMDYMVGEKLNIKEYIQAINPDYVIVLYNDIIPVDNPSGKYDFFSD